MPQADTHKALLVVLGNQLFPHRHLPPTSDVSIFMAEDRGLCTYVRHHQQKLVLFLAAMRAYAESLQAAGYQVHYHRFDANDERTYEQRLDEHIDARRVSELRHFEIEDKPMELRLIRFATSKRLPRSTLRSPMFTCSRDQFSTFANAKKRLLMADFYKQRRRTLGLLVDDDGAPLGGRWSFDTDNRRKLPKGTMPPAIHWSRPTRHVDDVIKIVREHFSDHPGKAEEFCWPATRGQALQWLDDFITDRLELFGPFEDAMPLRSETVFHSMLTPSLNLGLITPAEVLAKVMQRAGHIPLQSLEGFVRQLIGWREFVRGTYRELSEEQDSRNFWSHEREFTDSWYQGCTGLEPLDHAIKTANRLGWTHHIPRLMVLANLMTLCEIRPTSAHRWFMEMYVDSSEWVMGPNVYGMGLFSDGGLFATKPYICGSNYILKMSDVGKGPWCDTLDGLYWRFIDKHRTFFLSNSRLALMPKALDRIKPDRKLRIFDAAETFLASHTTT